MIPAKYTIITSLCFGLLLGIFYNDPNAGLCSALVIIMADVLYRQEALEFLLEEKNILELNKRRNVKRNKK